MIITIMSDDDRPNEVFTPLDEDGKPMEIHAIHGLVRALQRLEARLRQDVAIEETGSGYILGRKLVGPVLPIVQPSKEEKLEEPPQHPLATFIAHAMHKQRVGDKILERLTAKVDLGDGQLMPSPTEYWDADPKFKDYCVERRDYWLDKDSQESLHLVNLIRSYGTPTYGWLEWRERQPGIAKPDTSDIPFADE